MLRKYRFGGSLAGLVLAFAASAAAAPSPARSSKKGVGMWSFGGQTTALTNVGASWFYTWGTGPGGIAAPAGVTFVPMIWGSSEVTSSNLNTVKSEGPVLLGFNEPDNGGQSNMTPQQALALWPQLVATGMRLGSPAPAANAQAPGGWLDTFMSGATQKGLRVDFICLHWYGGNFDPPSAVSELQTYISETHARFNLPIWVTEYALTNYGVSPARFPTTAQQAAFASASVAMLESTPYVERYAWFELPPCTNNCAAGDNKALSLADGSLTQVGVAYAEMPDGGSATAEDAGVASQDGGPAGDGGSRAPSSADASGPPASDDAAASDDATATGAPSADDDASIVTATPAPEAGGAVDNAGPPSNGGGCSCRSAGGVDGTGGTRTTTLAATLMTIFLLRRRSSRRRSTELSELVPSGNEISQEDTKAERKDRPLFSRTICTSRLPGFL